MTNVASTLINAEFLTNLARHADRSMPVYPSPLFPPSPYYRFLQALAATLRPRLAAELGVCGGGGSLHMALGNPAGHVVGVDIARDHEEQMVHIETHCPNFRFWLGDSVMAAREVYGQYGACGLLFIDTTHTKERTIAEYQAWWPYLTADAIVCFDDLKRAEMGDFWDWLPGNKLRLDELHPIAEGGFGVIW